MTFEQFAAESLSLQLSYIADERARMAQASKTPGDKVALGKLGLHPLTSAEIAARVAQLDDMEKRAPEQFSTSAPGMAAAYRLNFAPSDFESLCA
ncbi:hypothetical protein [Sulfitobacter sp. 1A15106]|uniref:hypothetical protein n=1 Tax=Sulfitobacter sp. 1A15106 TaxID=3368590 RepID=UPI0037451EDC